MVPATAPPMIEGDEDLLFEDVAVVIVEIAEGIEVIESRVVLEEDEIGGEVAVSSTAVYTA